MTASSQRAALEALVRTATEVHRISYRTHDAWIALATALNEARAVLTQPDETPGKHQRRVVGHASGWQELLGTCTCGQPWPCSQAGPAAAPVHADPLARSPRPVSLPGKGLLNGICNRTACNNSPALWWSSVERAHYCDICAMGINHYCPPGVAKLVRVDPAKGAT